MYPVFLKDKGKQKYEKYLLNIFSKYPGYACWPLDDDLNTVAKTGVVRELSGLYPGAVSGVTYYNQVVVTGNITPAEALGTYTAIGIYNGRPYYTNGSFFCWVFTNGDGVISLGLGLLTGVRWASSAAFPAGTYFLRDAATGTATVTAVPASGIYRFDPAGVTFSQPGPVLGGALRDAAGFDGAAGKISIPFGNALDGKLMTVMGWVYLRGTGGQTARFADRVYDGQFACYFGASSRHLGLAIRGSLSTLDDTNTCAIPVPLNEWTHVAWVFGDSFYGGWVNGQTTGLKSANLGVLRASAAPIVLAGRTLDNTRQLNGDLAYVAIIPAALDANTIFALYQNSIK